MTPRLLIGCLTLLVLGGCVTSNIEQLRQTPRSQRIAADESVVVLGRRQHSAQYTEGDFTQCVADSLGGSGIKVYPRERFEDQLFPWFEPRTAPVAPGGLPKLLDDPAIEKRLRATGVRYMVWLDGATRDGDRGGGLSCAVGPGGGGCLGFAWWEKRAEYEAAIWDLQAGRSVGRLRVDASGTSYMPAVIVPLPLIARAESAACGGVADQIREVLKPEK